MTLLDIGHETAVKPLYSNRDPLTLAAERADRFRLFIERRRQEETRSVFHFNSRVADYKRDAEAHAYFIDRLTSISGISVPENLSLDAVSARRALDGASVGLYRNDELGIFVARQIIYLDNISTEHAKGLVAPLPGAMNVDYFGGYFHNHPEMKRALEPNGSL